MSWINVRANSLRLLNPTSFWWGNLLTALVYFLTGVMGLLLTIPPRYAAAVWMPAGVALSAIMIFGKRMTLGIALGAFLLNWILVAGTASSWQVSIAIGLGIGLGASLQALMGAAMIRRAGIPDKLTHLRSFCQFLILGGPVACMTNASIGLICMWSAGLVESDQLLSRWLSWWVGDSIGVLVTAPLCAVSLNKPRMYFDRRMLALSVPSLLCFVAAFAVFFYASHTMDSWMLLATGLFVTSMLSGLLFVMISSNQALRREVEGRIRAQEDLAASHERLLRREEDLENARFAAESASEAKSAFIANVSHEIRTPLAVVLGCSELLAEGGYTKGESERIVDAIKRNGELLSTVINDILDLSQLETGKLAVHLAPTELSDILADVTSLLALKAHEKGLAFSVEIAPDVPRVLVTDRLRLRQILLNIVGNAVKFTTAGTVKVRGSMRDGMLVFTIEDTGLGIKADQMAALFQPFVQADVTTKRRFGGAGLGLVIAKRLAQLLNGNVSLIESRPGSGSVFEISIAVTLPDLAELPAAARNVAAIPIKAGACNTMLVDMLILLVEDAPDVQFLVSRILKTLGCRVETAGDGRAAIDMAERATYDVILMDLQMPIMDGYEATSWLRTHGYERPIVALTAHALKEDRARCLARGFDDHLPKPVDRGVLAATLARYGPMSCSSAISHELASRHP